MKLHEVTGNTLEEIINEIDRRDFLKGLGAAAGLAAVGNVSSAPLKKNVTTDPMSGEKSNDFNIDSEDGRARLEMRLYSDPEKQMQGIVILTLKNDTFDWFLTNGAGRIKIGNNSPMSISSTLQTARTASLGGGTYASDLPKIISKHKGEILIQLPTKKHGLDPIKFKID